MNYVSSADLKNKLIEYKAFYSGDTSRMDGFYWKLKEKVSLFYSRNFCIGKTGRWQWFCQTLITENKKIIQSQLRKVKRFSKIASELKRCQIKHLQINNEILSFRQYKRFWNKWVVRMKIKELGWSLEADLLRQIS